MDTFDLQDAVAHLPLLLWDTAFPMEELSENRPYRNIGELLVKRSPTNRAALRLCGCDPAILNGEASDYECFAALCMAMPLLMGHRAAIATERVLQTVFGLDMSLSPYQVDELWTVLNEVIANRALRPSDVAEALNIESLCYRCDPLSSLPTHAFGEVDLYPVFDLSDPLATIANASPSDRGLDDAIRRLTERLAVFMEAGCTSVRIVLPKSYRFSRNSRKKEVDDLLWRLMAGKCLSTEEENQLLTALLIGLSYPITEHDLILLLHTEAEESELIALYDYFALNHAAPEALLITARPWDYADFFARHTHRTAKGIPSLLPVFEDFTTLAASFPIGATVLPCGKISDVISLAEGYRLREKLAQALSAYDADFDILSSLAEDVIYGNIKNRFSI